jgi:hypothetical protein
MTHGLKRLARPHQPIVLGAHETAVRLNRALHALRGGLLLAHEGVVERLAELDAQAARSIT